MSIKRKLTSVAVDSVIDYLHGKLNELKELDLDHDGVKDVEQVRDALNRISVRLKEVVEATDFQKLATGIDQIASGTSLMLASVDRQKLKETNGEIMVGLKQLGKLLQLGIQEVKRDGKLL